MSAQEMSEAVAAAMVPRMNAATLAKYQHDERMAQALKPSRNEAPSFKVSQVKAVGGNVVFEWDVAIPVCEEFPTTDEAFVATVEYAQKMVEHFPPPHGNGAS